MKTENEIVLETLKFYAENPKRRALTDAKTCMYFIEGTATEEPRYCAVGRCMTHSALKEYEYFVGGIEYLAPEKSLSFERLLEEEYRGHPFLFWTRLQHLHDNDIYWEGENSIKHRRRFVEEHFPDVLITASSLGLV